MDGRHHNFCVCIPGTPVLPIIHVYHFVAWLLLALSRYDTIGTVVTGCRKPKSHCVCDVALYCRINPAVRCARAEQCHCRHSWTFVGKSAGREPFAVSPSLPELRSTLCNEAADSILFAILCFCRIWVLHRNTKLFISSHYPEGCCR